MSIILLDVDNKVIEVSESIIYRSQVLESFFQKNTGKGYKLEYPNEIILQMINVLNNNDNVVISSLLINLCDQLEIDIARYFNMESWETKIIASNQAQYIFYCIFQYDNKIYVSSECIENTDEYATLKNEDKEIIVKSIEDAKKLRQTFDTIKLDNIINIPGKKIVLKTFEIGRLVKDKLREIKLNDTIFDQVVNLLVNLYSPVKNIIKPYLSEDYHCVLETQMNYQQFIVKLKIIQMICSQKFSPYSKKFWNYME